MEIKDKKLVSVLVGIIVILCIALGALYLSTPQGGPQGTPPTGMRDAAGVRSTTGTKGTTNSTTKNKANVNASSNSGSDTTSGGNTAASSDDSTGTATGAEATTD